MNSSAYALSIDAPVCRYVDLDSFTDLLPAQVLSEEERARAENLRSPIDRQRFVAAHIALRQALSEYTGLHNAALQLSTGSFGRPSLSGHTRTQFSLSHSQGLALIAIGGRGPLGADVELLRPVPDAAVLAAEYFTHREQEALAALPAHERDRAFLTCWSRKEACLKAIGVGLLVSSQTFEVGLAPERRSVELSVAGRILWLVVGPAPERLDCVGSLAEWRQTEARAQSFGSDDGGTRMSQLTAPKANTAARYAGAAQ
ncbi:MULTISPECIES: 4'-phosphopantetheinyl transferase superfamily protein [Variovorax]|jgi:4'-phosphopantetheinyl transferase|uniref:4'-phosphopantetheinyl transferase family protein n=1 Tax=Variovorax TaxID=34072 RepID=UPI0008D87652|nr:4'-phosphopantetheinyl transferase superfamily protein [Variovorax sp. OV084]SES92138.1 4'-phosphopantetheinyl transferase [Variovorax sp. OV084]